MINENEQKAWVILGKLYQEVINEKTSRGESVEFAPTLEVGENTERVFNKLIGWAYTEDKKEDFGICFDCMLEEKFRMPMDEVRESFQMGIQAAKVPIHPSQS
ncbi:hypothetical protein [Methanosarcina sp. WH1]|uniref:hypothetical protein n=1 Tax=Methanosarcina sp. WH1 TaxID=1434102 RepID=UPI0006155C05|nr:hypothetical protein [Methanosarcina sp. WH1]AKB22333.1 hypothetical protein MSWH1_2062 [Methanosarcina sp. WH1]